MHGHGQQCAHHRRRQLHHHGEPGGNLNYDAAANVGQSFSIAKASQTIVFAPLGGKTFGDAPFSVSATGGASGNAVVFASTTPGTCSVSSSTVTIEHAGSCTITANQAGNDDYNMAAEVSQSFTIAKAAATLTLSDLTHTYDGSPKAATVTVTPSGLSVVSVTYDGSATAPTNAGSYAVVASLTNDDYEATDATGTLVISKAAQTIIFADADRQDVRRRSPSGWSRGRRAPVMR